MFAPYLQNNPFDFRWWPADFCVVSNLKISLTKWLWLGHVVEIYDSRILDDFLGPSPKIRELATVAILFSEGRCEIFQRTGTAPVTVSNEVNTSRSNLNFAVTNIFIL